MTKAGKTFSENVISKMFHLLKKLVNLRICTKVNVSERQRIEINIARKITITLS